MTRQIFFVGILFAVLLAAGCRTTSTLDLARSPVSAARVQEIVRMHHAFIHSLKGEGRISVETPDISQTGSFELALQKPDTLLINIEGPFGIRVGSALITRTGFLFYSSLQNKLVTGQSSRENLNRILHVQLSFDDMLDLVSGGAFVTDDIRTPDTTAVDDDQYVFIYSSGTTSRRYWIDPATYAIRKIQFLDRGGSVTLEQAFSSFGQANGSTLPFSIRVTQPKSKNRVSLKYSDLVVNADSMPAIPTIPPNAEHIRWE